MPAYSQYASYYTYHSWWHIKRLHYFRLCVFLCVCLHAHTRTVKGMMCCEGHLVLFPLLHPDLKEVKWKYLPQFSAYIFQAQKGIYIAVCVTMKFFIWGPHMEWPFFCLFIFHIHYKNKLDVIKKITILKNFPPIAKMMELHRIGMQMNDFEHNIREHLIT